MAELWYYTREGKAMDPVSQAQLKKLAASGQLRPTDLVWKEGMPKWVRAGSAKELYGDEDLPGVAAAADEPPETIPGPRRRRRFRAAEDDDGFEDRQPRRPRDSDDDKRPRRKRGLSTGAKVGITAGILVTVLLVVGVVLLVVLGGGTQSRSFSVAAGQRQDFQISFKAGNKVEIWVKSTGRSDVDLYVYDANNRLVEFDDGDSSDCYVRFLAGKSQTFRVEVRNVRRLDQPWRNGPNSGTLTFKEGPLAPGEVRPPEFTNRLPGGGRPVGEFNAPFTTTNRLTWNDPVDQGRRGPGFEPRCKIYNVKMNAGTTYSIILRSQHIDAYLRLEDANGGRLAENDDGWPGINLDSHILFRCDVTGTYRVFATSLRPATGEFTLSVQPAGGFIK